MKLHSDSFPDNGVIPAEFAFAQIDQKVRVRFADNKNPARECLGPGEGGC